MVGDRTYQWAMHTAWGYPFNLLQNVIQTTGGYTHHRKKVSGATAGYILTAATDNNTTQVITTNITNPDVPRVLAITATGSPAASTVTITGVNIEGKVITDTIAYSASGQVLGKLVFKRVTSITFAPQSASTITVSVDTTNRIGLNQRCVPNYTTIVDVYDTAINSGPYPTNTRPVLDAAVTASNLDEEFVEKNWITTATVPNGTYFYYYFYWFYKVQVYPPKDSPQFYSTTTSTSTSSTSTSTSMSSTSTSTTTSVSTTTSTSISSTSTSTTTLPV